MDNRGTPSYGRIKGTTIGGIFMSRNREHLQQYKKQTLKLNKKELIRKKINEKLRFTAEQIHSPKSTIENKENSLNV